MFRMICVCMYYVLCTIYCMVIMRILNKLQTHEVSCHSCRKWIPRVFSKLKLFCNRNCSQNDFVKSIADVFIMVVPGQKRYINVEHANKREKSRQNSAQFGNGLRNRMSYNRICYHRKHYTVTTDQNDKQTKRQMSNTVTIIKVKIK